MEDKYYTPLTEEFYVGFEYEIRQADIWYKTLFQSNECLCDFINTDGYRVKYLDKEDIESLGWIYTKIDSNILSFTKDKITLELYPKHFSLPKERDRLPIVILTDYSVSSSRLFLGTIKNKSEFKKLIKQLDIE